MRITRDQVSQEVRINSTDPLFIDLKSKGVRDPKVILVFDNNAPPGSRKDWVHVFYVAPTALEEVDLNVNTILQNTKIKALDKEIIRTIYPEGYIGWCGWLNGQQKWIT
jgi:hypothetical protein